MKTHLFVTGLAAAAATGLAFGASAASIGVSFAGDNAGGTSIQTTAGTSAGVVAQTNWNAATGAAGALADVSDDGAGATITDVSWSSNNTWGGTGTSGGDEDMVNGWLDGAAVVDVTSITYATYDVYVYFSQDAGNEGRGSSVLVNGTEYNTAGVFANINGNGTFYNGHVDGASSADDPTYLVISGVSGAALNVTGNDHTDAAGTRFRGAISGVQIVEVPEPGSLALLGLGGLAMLRRRRG